MYEKYNIRILYLNPKASFLIRILAPKTNFSSDLKCNNKESLEDLLLNVNNISIIIEKEFTVECCVRGHHVYQSK